MQNVAELKVQIPLLNEAAASLRTTGEFRKDLSGQELAEIMSSVVKSLTASQDAVRANVQGMGVRIENSQGQVNGSVQVESPIQALITVNCVLGNDADPQRIRLVNLAINQKAGFLAKAALGAVNLEGKARALLSDPNQALRTVLESQLEPRRVKLSSIGLHFNQNTLAMNLRGSSLPFGGAK